MSRRRWEDDLSFDQLRPGVEPGWGAWTLHGTVPDLTDCIAGQLPSARHLLALWEPIATKAPSPSRCQPYCCYARTIIFYHRPYIARGSGYPWRANGRWLFERSRNGFAQFDQVETRLIWDDVVFFDGDEWEVGGGHVHWWRGCWWMRRWARRRCQAAGLEAA